jgi:outer membrane protein assembly factor BamB
MKSFKPLLILLLLVAVALAASGCTGSASIASSWPGLSVDGDTAFLAYNQFIYAVSLGNGSEKWRFPAEGNNKTTFFADPEKTPDGQLLVGSYNNVLHSLDPVSGQEKWNFPDAKSRFIANPLVTDQAIYAPTGGDILYALDLQGKFLWDYKTAGAVWAQPLFSADCNCIYLPSLDHHLYTINAQDGSLLWKSEKFNGSIVGTPVLDQDGNLYFGTFDSEIIKLNTRTHQSSQLVATDGWVWGGPLLKDKTLYFGDLKGSFYAVDTGTGGVLWKISADGPIIGSPAIDGQTIYFGTEAGTLYAVDLDGKELWNPNPHFDANLDTTPRISNGLILVALFKSDNLLAAVDQNGAIKWTYQPAK